MVLFPWKSTRLNFQKYTTTNPTEKKYMYMRAFIRQKVNACITKVTINNLGKKSSSIGPFSLEIDVIKVTEQKQPNTHTHQLGK